MTRRRDLWDAIVEMFEMMTSGFAQPNCPFESSLREPNLGVTREASHKEPQALDCTDKATCICCDCYPGGFPHLLMFFVLVVIGCGMGEGPRHLSHARVMKVCRGQEVLDCVK